jgi:hypothetical protein
VEAVQSAPRQEFCLLGCLGLVKDCVQAGAVSSCAMT